MIVDTTLVIDGEDPPLIWFPNVASDMVFKVLARKSLMTSPTSSQIAARLVHPMLVPQTSVELAGRGARNVFAQDMMVEPGLGVKDWLQRS